ncbi:MAG TPA: indole-3-glycerol phosphate synthase TrpC [Thermodesulfovibrio thiophilus]|uniref:indole-3-glycerol phosphate synthase TrpC n=1 Tax=Thermodesulfovibrio thiophilus TaxID=340095 RepID=UPI0017CCC867|nr:indole-3-glycerol phosphate synthase TrpC [Thermodesulfovibrio thiophilus]HHW20733.1 indole-3-glycerol phosphate synthase TrpC [Thermodesulfovibrio thiophilus]HQD36476.1 indole-3-glycerol phosphate synthase TrpC [Thermodesulfovibrio thiophilus]
MNILHKIVDAKKIRVENAKKINPLKNIQKIAESLARESSNFYSAIKRSPDEPINLIAEIKRASPSKGLLKDYDITEMADIYVSHGADAISVVTEEDFFLGSTEIFQKVKTRHSRIPVLRKDFIVDEYQIYESKLLKADAILLIACILTVNQCKTFYELSKALGMDVLFEIHDEEDLKKAIYTEADIVGINNRNLNTLQVDLDTTFRLQKIIPPGKLTVSESGISEKSHVRELIKHGIDAILVGTSLILSDNPGKKIKEFKCLV